MAAWDGPRVQLGAPDRQFKRHLATQFVDQHAESDPGAQRMGRDLRTVLYQRVDGSKSNRNNFRERDLPVLDGMLVSLSIFPCPVPLVAGAQSATWDLY